MCGICGVVGFGQPEQALETMLPFLRHRGPDNTGRWVDGRTGLGHTRLSIVDLTPSGHQPLANEDESCWLTANGEIYNSPELRRWLEERGHRFRSGSDNETILHLYEEDEPGFLSRLNGMFAFALWDKARRRLLLARDRLGIKPLYYYPTHDGLIFASEIKAILSCPEVDAGLDPEGLRQYLTYENTFGPTTLHKGVRMVEPGQFLIRENGRTRTGYYWQPRLQHEADISFDRACASYLETVERAVKRHLMSDVEVASYLSSGFDSTSVATLASSYVSGDLATYTGAFAFSDWYDETPGSQAVAERIGSKHTVVQIGSQDLRQNMDDLIYALDEPRMGIGAFPQYMVARAAAKRVKVILTGHGGDELFAGYPVFKLIHLQQQSQARRFNFFRQLIRVRPAEWPHLIYFTGQKLRGGANGYFLPVLFSEAMQARALQPEVYDQLKDIPPEKELQQLLQSEDDPYHRLLLIYLRAYLPGLFVVEDKISMAHSLEARTPLCENELVDLALSWPLSVKIHQGRLKAVPKAAMRDRLPEILYRLPKRGFPTPLSKWLRTELRDWARDRLLAPESPLNRIFRPESLAAMFKSYIESWRRSVRVLDEIQTHRMWCLLSLEAWLRLSEQRLGRRLL